MISTVAAAVLLDMDGTLVDSTAVVERLWSEWSLGHGIDPARTLAIIHGRQGQDSMAMLLPERPHEQNIAENRALLARESVELEGVAEIPGAAALLDQLAGLPHALVTSATRELAAARMGAAGMALPEVSVTAEDVAVGKPDPAVFLAAARLLDVQPVDCVVVEDSANGIMSGLAAGMRVIGVGPHAADHAPTWTVASVADIRAVATGAGIRITLTT